MNVYVNHLTKGFIYIIKVTSPQCSPIHWVKIWFSMWEFNGKYKDVIILEAYSFKILLTLTGHVMLSHAI